MMMEPSYLDLINKINENIEDPEEKVKSRYTVVVAVAKRARQLVDNEDERLVEGVKPISIAIDELNNGDINIVPIAGKY